MSTWIDVFPLDKLDDEDVLRFDHDGKTFAIYRVGDTACALTRRSTCVTA